MRVRGWIEQRRGAPIIDMSAGGLINALAVELARVSLWVETLDPDLPFSFLDHKIKVGNSLVGCWLDRVEDYPLKAWEREGGDGPKGERSQRIEEFLKGHTCSFAAAQAWLSAHEDNVALPPWSHNA